MSAPISIDPGISQIQKDDARLVFEYFRRINLFDEIVVRAIEKALSRESDKNNDFAQSDLSFEPSLHKFANAYHVFNHFVSDGFLEEYKVEKTRTQIARLLKGKIDVYANDLMDGKVYGFKVVDSKKPSAVIDCNFEFYVRRLNKLLRFSAPEFSTRNVETIDGLVSRFDTEGLDRVVYTGPFPNPGTGLMGFLNIYRRDYSSQMLYSPLSESQRKALEDKGIKTVDLPRLI